MDRQDWRTYRVDRLRPRTPTGPRPAGSPFTTALVEPIDEHRCTLRAGANSLDELAMYVASQAFDFQVHEPPELVEHIRALAARGPPDQRDHPEPAAGRDRPVTATPQACAASGAARTG